MQLHEAQERDKRTQLQLNDLEAANLALKTRLEESNNNHSQRDTDVTILENNVLDATAACEDRRLETALKEVDVVKAQAADGESRLKASLAATEARTATLELQLRETQAQLERLQKKGTATTLLQLAAPMLTIKKDSKGITTSLKWTLNSCNQLAYVG